MKIQLHDVVFLYYCEENGNFASGVSKYFALASNPDYYFLEASVTDSCYAKQKIYDFAI